MQHLRHPIVCSLVSCTLVGHYSHIQIIAIVNRMINHCHACRHVATLSLSPFRPNAPGGQIRSDDLFIECLGARPVETTKTHMYNRRCVYHVKQMVGAYLCVMWAQRDDMRKHMGKRY